MMLSKEANGATYAVRPNERGMAFDATLVESATRAQAVF